MTVHLFVSSLVPAKSSTKEQVQVPPEALASFTAQASVLAAPAVLAEITGAKPAVAVSAMAAIQRAGRRRAEASMVYLPLGGPKRTSLPFGSLRNIGKNLYRPEQVLFMARSDKPVVTIDYPRCPPDDTRR